MLIFENINEWSKHKVRLVACLFWFLYYTFATIVPIIIVSVKYSLVKKQYQITLAGWIVLILCATVGLKTLFRVAKNLPVYTRGEQFFKAILNCAIRIVIPVLVLVVIHMIRIKMNTALDCIMWSTISMIGAIVVDCFLLKPLETQLDLIKAKEKQNAINKVNA